MQDEMRTKKSLCCNHRLTHNKNQKLKKKNDSSANVWCTPVHAMMVTEKQMVRD